MGDGAATRPSEPAAAGEPVGRDAVGQAEAADLEAGGVGVAVDARTGRTPCRASRRSGPGPGRRARRGGRRSRASSRSTAATPFAGRTFATIEPRCGQSLVEGRLGVGVRLGGEVAGQQPMGRREVRGVVVASSSGRSPAGRSGGASSGKCSLIRTPGVLVAIGLNSPRISSGASGLGSQVSSWLGPPHMKTSRHDFARPKPSAEPRRRGGAAREEARHGQPGQREGPGADRLAASCAHPAESRAARSIGSHGVTPRLAVAASVPVASDVQHLANMRISGILARVGRCPAGNEVRGSGRPSAGTNAEGTRQNARRPRVSLSSAVLPCAFHSSHGEPISPPAPWARRTSRPGRGTGP